MSATQKQHPVTDPSEITNDVNGFNVSECTGLEQAEIYVSLPNLGYGLLANIMARYKGRRDGSDYSFYSVDTGSALGGSVSLNQLASGKGDSSVVIENLVGDDMFMLLGGRGYTYKHAVLCFPANRPCQDGDTSLRYDLKLPIPLRVQVRQQDADNYQTKVIESNESDSLQRELLYMSYWVANESRIEDDPVPASIALEILRAASITAPAENRGDSTSWRFTSGRSAGRGEYLHLRGEEASGDVDLYQAMVAGNSVDDLSLRLFHSPSVFVLLPSGTGSRLYYSPDLTEKLLASIEITGKDAPPLLSIDTSYATIADYDSPSWVTEVSESVILAVLGIVDSQGSVTGDTSFSWYVQETIGAKENAARIYNSNYLWKITSMKGMYCGGAYGQAGYTTYYTGTDSGVSLTTQRPPCFTAGELVLNRYEGSFLLPFSSSYLLPLGTHTTITGVTRSSHLSWEDIISRAGYPVAHRTTYPATKDTFGDRTASLMYEDLFDPYDPYSLTGNVNREKAEYLSSRTTELAMATDGFYHLRWAVNQYLEFLSQVSPLLLKAVATRALRTQDDDGITTVTSIDEDEAGLCPRFVVENSAPGSFDNFGTIVSFASLPATVLTCTTGYDGATLTPTLCAPGGGMRDECSRISSSVTTFADSNLLKTADGISFVSPLLAYSATRIPVNLALSGEPEYNKLYVTPEALTNGLWGGGDGRYSRVAPSYHALSTLDGKAYDTVYPITPVTGKAIPYVIARTPQNILPPVSSNAVKAVNGRIIRYVEEVGDVDDASGYDMVNGVSPVGVSASGIVSFASMFSDMSSAMPDDDGQLLDDARNIIEQLGSTYQGLATSVRSMLVRTSVNGGVNVIIAPQPPLYMYSGEVESTVASKFALSTLDVPLSLFPTGKWGVPYMEDWKLFSAVSELSNMKQQLESGSGVSAVRLYCRQLAEELSDVLAWAVYVRDNLITGTTTTVSFLAVHYPSLPSTQEDYAEGSSGSTYRTLTIASSSALATCGFWLYNLRKTHLLAKSMYDFLVAVISRAITLLLCVGARKAIPKMRAVTPGETTYLPLRMHLFTGSDGSPVYPEVNLPSTGVSLSTGGMFPGSQFVNSIADMFSEGTLSYKITMKLDEYNGPLKPVILPGLGLPNSSAVLTSFNLSGSDPWRAYFAHLDANAAGDPSYDAYVDFCTGVLLEASNPATTEEPFEHIKQAVSLTDYVVNNSGTLRMKTYADPGNPSLVAVTTDSLAAMVTEDARQVSLRPVDVVGKIDVSEVIPYSAISSIARSIMFAQDFKFKSGSPASIDTTTRDAGVLSLTSSIGAWFDDASLVDTYVKQAAEKVYSVITNPRIVTALATSATARSNFAFVVTGLSDSQLASATHGESSLVAKALSLITGKALVSEASLITELGAATWTDAPNSAETYRNYNLNLSRRRAHVVASLIAQRVKEKLDAHPSHVGSNGTTYTLSLVVNGSNPGGSSFNLFRVVGLGSLAGNASVAGYPKLCRGVYVACQQNADLTVAGNISCNARLTNEPNSQLISAFSMKLSGSSLSAFSLCAGQPFSTYATPSRTDGQWNLYKVAGLLDSANSISVDALYGLYGGLLTGGLTTDELYPAVDKLGPGDRVAVNRQLSSFIVTNSSTFDITKYATAHSGLAHVWLTIA